MEELLKLKELFSDRSRWTQAALSRDKYGCSSDPEKEYAYSFCLVGGCEKIAASNRDLFCIMKDRLRRYLPTTWDTLTGFNDNSTYEEVMALIDKAINGA